MVEDQDDLSIADAVLRVEADVDWGAAGASTRGDVHSHDNVVPALDHLFELGAVVRPRLQPPLAQAHRVVDAVVARMLLLEGKPLDLRVKHLAEAIGIVFQGHDPLADDRVLHFPIWHGADPTLAAFRRCVTKWSASTGSTRSGSRTTWSRPARRATPRPSSRCFT